MSQHVPGPDSAHVDGPISMAGHVRTGRTMASSRKSMRAVCQGGERGDDICALGPENGGQWLLETHTVRPRTIHFDKCFYWIKSDSFCTRWEGYKQKWRCRGIFFKIPPPQCLLWPKYVGSSFGKKKNGMGGCFQLGNGCGEEELISHRLLFIFHFWKTCPPQVHNFRQINGA